jgi:formiminoglutamase
MYQYLSYFEPIHFIELTQKLNYNPLQIGHKIKVFPHDDFDFDTIDIFIVGCGESRTNTVNKNWNNAPDAIRRALYKMYDWHNELNVADLGNIIEGPTVQDTKAALTTILEELYRTNKIVLLLGGSQELTIQQFSPFKKQQHIIEMATIDMLIDLEDSEEENEKSFLMNMLTEQPNYIEHFSNIGFQSYYTNPSVLQTLDRLRFDCYRLGRVRSQLEEIEPVLRSCSLLSIDLNVLRASEAPFLKNASPNGLFGDELCQLMRYAGMSEKMQSVGIYGYREEDDLNETGAELVAQMLWYFVDGFRIQIAEYPLTATQEFESFHVNLSQTATTFLKSKRTNRWWMQMPNGNYIPASYNDYVTAAANDLPERWLRAQERL